MASKKIIIFVVVVIAIHAAIGISVGLIYLNDQRKEQMQNNMRYLIMMPVEFRVQILTDGDWSGYDMIAGSFGLIGGTGDFEFKCLATEGRVMIDLDSGSYLTVNLFVLNKLVDQDSTSIINDTVWVYGESPYKDYWYLIFLV